jgi:hypothetical protein
VLAKALQNHGQTYAVVKVVDSIFGSRYAIDGILETPTHVSRLFERFGFSTQAQRSRD